LETIANIIMFTLNTSVMLTEDCAPPPRKAKTKSARSLHYRPDIDGLRAVAVLSVLAYHLKISWFRGGFVGVDIFFVISGYLISAIILKDISSRDFSIATFYERRVRRIFPALIVTLLGTSCLAYLYFLPAELVNFAKSLLAALFSASNFYFWKHSGYFSAPVETIPLIHTWSLAVEEQFYVFLPIFLAAAHRYFPRKVRLSVILIAVLSFIVSAVGAFRYPTATFYLAHTRAWELMLGVLISLEVFPAISRPMLRNLATAAGIALICFAVFAYSSATPFPGIAALAPCAGAALIVAAGRSGSSLVGRVLSLKPVTFIGLISYSLYLWHWPIIVFQTMESPLMSGASVRAAKLISIFVSLAVATLSWKFVETPFRASRIRMARIALFKVAAAAAAAVAAVGITALISQGFPSRYPSNAIQVASYLDYDSAKYFRDGKCFISSEYKYSDYDFSQCLREDPGKKNYLLFGDSHAAHLWYGLSTKLDGVNLLQATASGCKPTLDQSLLTAATCKQMMSYVYKDYLPSHRVDRLLIAARWQSEDELPLSRSLDWLKDRGITVVLFGPMLQYDMALPRLLAFSIRGHDQAIPDEHRVDQRALDDAMSELAEQKGVEYVSFYRSLCGPRSCEEFAVKDVPLQFDYGHLTKEGSLLVAQKVIGGGDLR
jgi:peptidoglycan/LPS O-acetylase OafA/YrhL